jgi:hypothetical protein
VDEESNLSGGKGKEQFLVEARDLQRRRERTTYISIALSEDSSKEMRVQRTSASDSRSKERLKGIDDRGDVGGRSKAERHAGRDRRRGRERIGVLVDERGMVGGVGGDVPRDEDELRVLGVGDDGLGEGVLRDDSEEGRDDDLLQVAELRKGRTKVGQQESLKAKGPEGEETLTVRKIEMITSRRSISSFSSAPCMTAENRPVSSISLRASTSILG